MQREESLYPEDWFSIGDREIKRARYLLEAEDLIGAGFNIQQALEKYLKGYLLAQGWGLKRVHSLEFLLNEAVKYESSFEEFRFFCRKISEYYFEDRYPFTIPSELTEEELKESLEFAEKLIGEIKERCG